MEAQPLFSFGILADVQYADKEQGHMEGRSQRYREAPEKLRMAVADFNRHKESLAFVVTLGDIIDGNETQERTRADFDVVLRELSKLEVPNVYHTLGNHCLRLPREDLLSALSMPSLYYHVPLAPGWRLAVLDSMDMSLAWPAGSEHADEAQAFIAAGHPLVPDDPEVRTPEESGSRMARWNGGLGSRQMAWLQALLKDAAAQGEKVIVCLHHPLVVNSSPSSHLLWNAEEVVGAFAGAGVVPLVLSGHYHPGGYVSLTSTHFVVVEAILESPEGTPAHAVADVYTDRIVIRGSGSVTSRELVF